jgi:2-dehydro-3-deoxygalactonokinase
MECRESAAGVFSVREGRFAEALLPLCTDWLGRYGLPLLACGMIGSRQGVAEVPYVPCPAGLSELAGHLGQVELPLDVGGAPSGLLRLYIVPGLSAVNSAGDWDVMRGEETQLLGVLDADAPLFVLPGTHSKWVSRDCFGRIESFQTYMTGELYELLRNHSSLGRVMDTGVSSDEAFLQGVAQASSEPIDGLLFRVRTAGLMGRLRASELPDYLSGMLIGAEIKAGLNRFSMGGSRTSIPLLGSAHLTRRYATAFGHFGQAVNVVSGDVVFQGLFSMALEAGLVALPPDL